MRKNLLIAGAVVLALFVTAMLGLAVSFDADQLRPRLEAEMTRSLGRTVALGHVRLALLSGAVSVEDVSIGDDPGFGAAPFVTAKALKVGVDMLPLIASRTLHVQSFTLEQPHVVLLRSASGVWNFSNLGAPLTSAGTSSSQSGSSSTPTVSVRKLTIADGRIVVGETGSKASTRRVYDGVGLESTDLSYASQFPFRIRANTPGAGTVSIDGRAGPLDADDIAATPVQATVRVNHLDLAATGFVDPASGIGGAIDFTGTVTSDGRLARSKGTLRASKLQLVQGSSPAQLPIDVDYESDYDVKRQSGVVRQGDVHIGKALAHLTGNFVTAGGATTAHMKLSGHHMPVPELEAGLPAIGVTLPAGASFQEGTLDVDLSITGPLDRLVTTGPVSMTNATVRSFDLGSKLGGVAAFAGLSKNANTVIQTLSSTLRVAPDGIRADDLQMIVPSIGSLAGSGTIAPKGALNFRMLAKLRNAAGLGGAVARVMSLGRPENGTPFRIEGTTANPVFVPDVAAAVRNAVKPASTADEAGGLLRGVLTARRK